MIFGSIFNRAASWLAKCGLNFKSGLCNVKPQAHRWDLVTGTNGNLARYL
jgi:hypothetical protein